MTKPRWSRTNCRQTTVQIPRGRAERRRGRRKGLAGRGNVRCNERVRKNKMTIDAPLEVLEKQESLLLTHDGPLITFLHTPPLIPQRHILLVSRLLHYAHLNSATRTLPPSLSTAPRF